MKTVRQMLESKAHKGVVCISSSASVLDALKLMADHNIGALPVLDDGRLVGIFSERDYARRGVLEGRASKDTPVRELMTERVVYVTPERTNDEVMALMTEKKVRHLPVLGHDMKLMGMVSIGDAVKETISDQQFIIQQLEEYITR